MTKSGKRLNISLTVSPVKDSAGRIVGASKIARDVTESKRIEQALREGEARLRAAFSQTYSFLVLADAGRNDHRGKSGSPGSCRAFKREEAIGRKFWELWWSRLPDEVGDSEK